MNLLVWFACLGCIHMSLAVRFPDLYCYLDSESFSREGLAKFSISDLELAIPYCSHLVFGYMGIDGDTYELSLVNANKYSDNIISNVTALKTKYPHLKVLLSVGGDHDIDEKYPNKYMNLLEFGEGTRQIFTNSAHEFIKKHGFDGLDLAYQFPRNKPREVLGWFASVWESIKRFFTGESVVDPKSDEHKHQFTELMNELNNTLRKDGLIVGMTVLPNVNSTWYFDVRKLNELVDFVNLAAFDFVTPARNPKEADYTAQLFDSGGENHPGHYNGEFQLTHWFKNGMTKRKLLLGIPTYGNAWKLTKDSGTDGKPIVPNTEGPAPAGLQSKKPGLLSYPEICLMLPNQTSDAPLIQEHDDLPFYGTYAFRPQTDSGKDGIWISYENIQTVLPKSTHVSAKGYGAVSLFDLSYDDFRGLCTGEKYPLLKNINKDIRPLDSFEKPLGTAY